jgi:pantoate kinase
MIDDTAPGHDAGQWTSCFDNDMREDGSEGSGLQVTPLVGLLVLLGGGSSKTESRPNGGVPLFKPETCEVRCAAYVEPQT